MTRVFNETFFKGFIMGLLVAAFFFVLGVFI